jgi:hypothetical protein
MANVIRFGAARWGERVQGAYGDFVQQIVPFVAEPGLEAGELFNRLAWAVYRKFQPRNGYEARLLAVDAAAGEIVIQHYFGIGE